MSVASRHVGEAYSRPIDTPNSMVERSEHTQKHDAGQTKLFSIHQFIKFKSIIHNVIGSLYGACSLGVLFNYNENISTSTQYDLEECSFSVQAIH